MRLYIPVLDNGAGDVKANFLHSFLGAFSGMDVHVARASDSHPGRNRNKVAASFLETDREFLLFIDGDIHFTRRDIDFLAESEEPILCGMYPLKDVRATRLCVQTLQGYTPEPGRVYIPVARAGTGFMRVHRNVFEAMKTDEILYTNHGRDEWDFFPSGVVNREWLSEDWYFCDRAREIGFEVIVDTRIQLRHEGSAIYPLPQEESQ